MGETHKICLISPDFIPVWSGIGAYTVTFLEQIPKDVEIHLVTVKRKIPKIDLSLQTTSSEVLDKIKERVNIYYISEASNTFSYNLAFQLSCLKKIPSLCKKENLQLVHSNFPLMSDIYVKLFNRIRIPTLTTVQSTIDGQHKGVFQSGLGLSSLETSDLANLLLYQPLRLLELLYMSTTPYYIAISESIINELHKYFGVERKQIRLIYHGVNTDRFSPPTKNLYLKYYRPIVLFTGRFVATKGIDVLIKAIPEVLKNFRDTLFLFVGGGNYEPYLELLKRLRIPKQNYLFKGYVDFFDMPSLYKAATIYVAPTIYEPLGIRVIEAMSCEKPVIASKVGGIPEIIDHGKNGYLVPPLNHKAISDHIKILLADNKLAEQVGKQARKKVLEKFSAEEMIKRTVDLYKHLLR
ncbi:glycosyltransferase [Thaumarchaeota archaeon SCGC AB-539-E09]|nr:glycosyltransferase [Thaumarchaeota archaeon SCGC AB-539-E09]